MVKIDNKDTDKIVMEWIVEKVLWGGMYSVILDGGMKVHAKPKWKLIKSRIKIVMWDKVQVELNEIDPTKWYITYRL